jgi:hypothetical protein
MLWNDLRHGKWTELSEFGISGSLKTVSGELAKYKLDFVGVQEVIWNKGGTQPAGNYNSFYGNGIIT